MTYASPLLQLPGAVPAEGLDAGVAAHYGDPFREQRRLDDGEGFVDLSHRPVVAISGPDRLSWLHSLTTQHLLELPAGRWTQTLVLSPQGHVEHHLHLVDDGETTWAHVEPGTAEALIEFLDSMRFLLRVEVREATAERAVVWDSAQPGFRLLARDELPGWAAGAGAPAGIWAYEALRIAAHRPRFGLDTDHRTLPNEVGWLADADNPNAVHLAKGCYRGQEAVARVHTLGRPPRRLVFLHLDGSDDVLPSPGAAVELDGHPERGPVGFVGSAARHYELGPIALALVKRNVPVDAPLLAAGVAAAQEVVVPPEVGERFDPRAALQGGTDR